VATSITRLDRPGSGPRIAVKDVIDIAGVPTTAGCKAVAAIAEPAARDAACMAGARAADVAGLTAGMALLEPGFAVTEDPAARVGRLRPPSDELDPRIDAAVDAELLLATGALVESAVGLY
jgi:hypothetical protein